MIDTFIEKLKTQTDADCYFDDAHKKIYSVDASIYEILPIGVVLPRSTKDIVEIAKLAKEFNVPLIARGAATGIAGGCIGKGLIIDTSLHLNKILEINEKEEYVLCEPGVVQDRLNEELAKIGYRLGPDTSTGDRATLGGMTASNSAGAHSLLYGMMVDHVEAIELVLSTGDIVYLKEFDLKSSKKTHLEDALVILREKYKSIITKEFPNLPRRVSGYNLNELIKPHTINPAKLVVGSEGTLGIITKVKLKIVKKPLFQSLIVFSLKEFNEAFLLSERLLHYRPSSLELIDSFIIKAGKHSPVLKNKLLWLSSDCKAILSLEFTADTEGELAKKNAQVLAEMQELNPRQLVDTEIKDFWALRKLGLGLLLSKRSYTRAIAFIEDISIPPAHLKDFMKEFLNYLKSKDKEAGIYGHIGAGCMHIRPYINLRDDQDLKLMKEIMEDVAKLVLKFNGALSGEHGDGLVRSFLTEKMFGKTLYEAFKELKNIFDPFNLMNPHKIVDGLPFLDNLRLTHETPIKHIPTFLDFSKEGGLELSIDLCNGNGACRKKEGIMCPSFQATENEYDSTRARAQILRRFIHENKPTTKKTEKEIQEVLELCLQCKGCKTECPSQVDMAKFKAEFLYQYQKKYGIPLKNWLFGNISRFFSLGSFFPSVSNFFLEATFFRAILDKIGIAKKAPLPKLARQKFSSYKLKDLKSSKKVVLFNDTFTEFIHPEVGLAAFKFLTSIGYEVIIPQWRCCGRPAFSKGLLDKAKKQAEKLIKTYLPLAKKGYQIVGLEPSCLFTIIDDYPSLINDNDLHILIKSCFTFDEFVSSLNLKFKNVSDNIYFHTHCYQKSLKGSKAMKELLSSVKGQEINSGCCGMAGSFGYEKEHIEISEKIGELKLFPFIRKLQNDDIVIANGFSCRSQIMHGTNKRPLHLAEWLLTVEYEIKD